MPGLKTRPVLEVTPTKPVSGAAECTLCEILMQEVDNLLKKNDTVVSNCCLNIAPDKTKK